MLRVLGICNIYELFLLTYPLLQIPLLKDMNLLSVNLIAKYFLKIIPSIKYRHDLININSYCQTNNPKLKFWILIMYFTLSIEKKTFCNSPMLSKNISNSFNSLKVFQKFLPSFLPRLTSHSSFSYTLYYSQKGVFAYFVPF